MAEAWDTEGELPTAGAGALASLTPTPAFPGLRTAAEALIPDPSTFGETLDSAQRAKAAAIDRAIQRLTEAQSGSKAAALAALSAGFLSPTRAGSFGESLGAAMGQVAPHLNQMDQQRQQSGNLIDQLRVQQAQLPADSLMKRLSYAGQLSRLSGMSGGRPLQTVVQDPNSPTGWSVQLTALNGQSMGTIPGTAPPRQTNAPQNFPTTPDGLRIVDDKTWATLLARGNSALDQAIKNSEVDLPQGDVTARNRWLLNWIAVNAKAAPPGTNPEQEFLPTIGGTQAATAPRANAPAPAGTTPAAQDTGAPASPTANPILQPLPPRQGAVRPGLMDDVRKYTDANRDISEGVAILADLRAVNEQAWYQGIPTGKGSTASLAPETSARAHLMWDKDNPGAQATTRMAANLERLTASLAKATLGAPLSDRDLAFIKKMNGAVTATPQERENLFSQAEYLLRKKIAYNEVAASYVAHGRSPPPYVEWDKAYTEAKPFPAMITTGSKPAPRAAIVPQAQPPENPQARPSNIPATPRERKPGLLEQLTPAERETLLAWNRKRQGNPSYQMNEAERALSQKLNKIQQEAQ